MLEKIIQAIQNNSITSIDLKWNNIGSEGAKVLAEVLKSNNSIASINLSGNGIGSEGAKVLAEALKSNHSITSINLAYTKIGSEGAKVLAEALKSNKSITSINFGSNNIGSEGAKAIAEALKFNNSITSINLQGNYIGSEGAKVLAGALKSNHSITSINLERNNIGIEQLSYLDEIIARNKNLFQTNINNIKQGKELEKVTPETFLGILKYQIINTEAKNLKKEYEEIQAIMEGKYLSAPTHPQVKQPSAVQSSSIPKIPTEFQCTITNQIMMDPVILIGSGETYEREEIEKWLLNHNTDPLTNVPLTNKSFIPNRNTKRSIIAFLDSYPFNQFPGLWEEVYIPKQFTQQLLTVLQSKSVSEIKRLMDQAPQLLTKTFENHQTLLHLICQQDNASLLGWSIKQLGEQFWQHPLVVKEDGAECFRSIAALGKVDMARIWAQALKWGETDYQIELDQALKESNLKAIEVCIALGANVNESITGKEPPIHQAISSDQLGLLEILLQAKADVNILDQNGEAPLHKAVRSGNIGIVRKLLDLKPELELKNKQGQTGFAIALECKHYEIAQSLIDMGADTKTTDKEGNTILIQLISQGQDVLVRELLSHISIKGSLEQRNEKGATALLHATALSRTSIVSALLENGANTEARDKEGNTALHLAATSGQKEIVMDLLRHNAPAKALNNANQTPITAARSMGQTAIADLIDLERMRIKLQPFIQPLQQELLQLKELVTRQQEIIQGLQGNGRQGRSL